jgi:hypothetical protein
VTKNLFGVNVRLLLCILFEKCSSARFLTSNLPDEIEFADTFLILSFEILFFISSVFSLIVIDKS